VQAPIPDAAINSDVLAKEIYYRHQYTVIATFLNPLHGDRNLELWHRALTAIVAPGRILHCGEAGGGFMYVTTDAPATTH
jgi:hypothetical protein